MSRAAAAHASTFRHGVHPDESKEATRDRSIERMPFVEEYVLPLSQHSGRPSIPRVRAGERVLRGQRIGDPDGFISTALHAPVTGTVAALELRPHPNGGRLPAIVIRCDPFDSQRLRAEPLPHDTPPDGLVEQVQRAGLVGLGGAAFPSHVKLRVPEGRQVRFVILNGCECEPYLTCDHRVMLERAPAVLAGLRRMMALVGAERGYVGIELNKADAIEALQRELGSDGAIEVVPLAVKYPQGAEKALIDAILHREVPSGKLPLDLEILVQNVATAVGVADLFDSGRPLIERVVTVTGSAVRRPANLIVPIGTPLADVLSYCGAEPDAVRQVVLGGPMMGMPQKRLDVPIVKGVSGVLAMSSAAPMVEEEPCIRCGRCLEACPMFLNPQRLALLVRHDDDNGLRALHMLDCYECGSCSFVCPSRIPLVQLMRMGKALVRQREKPA